MKRNIQHIKCLSLDGVNGVFKVSPLWRVRWAFLLLFSVLLITSCSDDDDDDSDEVWKLKNEQAFDEIANNPAYTKLESLSGVGVLYYKVLKAGEQGGRRPLYTSRAEVYYKGTFVVTDENKNISEGDVFDSKLFEDGTPFNVALSAGAANYSTSNPNGYSTVITGWTDALQHMVVGDKWEVWLPYKLAYGESASGNIPAYSTLCFEIELMKVIDVDEF